MENYPGAQSLLPNRPLRQSRRALGFRLLSLLDLEHRKNINSIASEFEEEQANEDDKPLNDDTDRAASTKIKKGKTGKRKGKKVREGDSGVNAQTNLTTLDDGYSAEDGQALEAENMYEGEEPATVEGDGEEGETEIAAKTEEECKSYAHLLVEGYLYFAF